MPDTPAAADSLLVKLVTHPLSTWLIRRVCAPIDPLLYRATNGRLFTMGPGNDAMVTVTMIGRRSGKARSVHLACVAHEGDYLIVASAMGQERHPAWRYNLEANPNVELQMAGERFAATAQVLSADEKVAVWDKVREAIPMIHVYESRTDRDIRVFRLRRA